MCMDIPPADGSSFEFFSFRTTAIFPTLSNAKSTLSWATWQRHAVHAETRKQFSSFQLLQPVNKNLKSCFVSDDSTVSDTKAPPWIAFVSSGGKPLLKTLACALLPSLEMSFRRLARGSLMVVDTPLKTLFA